MSGIMYDPVDQYNDQLDPIGDYISQMTLLVSKKKKIPMEQARAAVLKMMKERFKDREIRLLATNEHGDREIRDTTYAHWLKHQVKAKNIITPNNNVHIATEVMESPLADFSRENVKLRSKDKIEAADAKAAGNIEVAESKEGSQNNRKRKNNIISGLKNTKFSIIYNPTSHSTLTSMTRSITSITNASNERVIAGNRALFSPQFAFWSIINEVTFGNRELVEEACKTYNLHIPSVDDVVEVLKYSGDMYNKDERYYTRYIRPFLEDLTGYERAVIVYSTDLYHLLKFNPVFGKTLMTEMIKKMPCDDVPMENPNLIKKEFTEGVIYFAHNVYAEEIKGLGKNYEKMNELGIASGVYNTCKNIMKVMNEHKLYFNAFFKHKITPINSHRLQYLRRRAVILSDTDSSGFSVDLLCQMIFGHRKVNGETIALTGGLTHIATENVIHQLSMFSSRMNISTHLLRQLGMKNEWYWTLFVPAEITKHYTADAYIREGSVYPITETEIKGVHMKNSVVPKVVIQRGFDILNNFMHSIRDDEPLYLNKILHEVVDIESDIIHSTKIGETEFLKSDKIKQAESYKEVPEKSKYREHIFWQEVFAPKYGECPEPEYSVVKLPTTLRNKTAINNWIAGIEDVEFKIRLAKWYERTKRPSLKTMYMNMEYIRDKGIPKEIIPIINTDKIVADMTTQPRHLLNSYGVNLNPDFMVKDQLNLKNIEYQHKYSEDYLTKL